MPDLSNSPFRPNGLPTNGLPTPQGTFQGWGSQIQNGGLFGSLLGQKAVDPNARTTTSPNTLPKGQAAPNTPVKPVSTQGVGAPGSPQAAAAQQSKDYAQYFPGVPVPVSTTPASTNTPATAPTPATPIPSTANTSSVPSYPNGLYGDLIKRGTDALAQSAALTGQIQTAQNNIYGNPNFSLDTQVGRAGLIQNNVGVQADALAKQGAAYLQGAQAAAPQLGQYGQTYYNPTTGTTASGSGSAVSPTDPLYPVLQQYAKLYASGQQGAIPGSITSNPVLNAQVLAMAQQINPSFNYNNATGTAAGQQQVAGSLPQMESAEAAAQGIQNQISSYIASNPTLNPSDSTFANSISQWAQGQQLGDPRYQNLANLLSEYVSTLAPILGVGGDTTNLKTQIAQSFVNGAASGQSISQVLQGIGTIASGKVAAIKGSVGLPGGVSPSNVPNIPSANNNPLGI